MRAVKQRNLSFTATPEEVRAWRIFFRELASMIPVAKPSMPISEHAERYRRLPSGDRYEGPLRLDRSPYLREIMDCMSPNSPVQHVIVMKAAQLGFTMALECVMCYYLGYAPCDQLLVTATAQLYKRWVSRRLEPAITSYGYREKIFAQEKRKSGKETGDKMATKEYIGGQLDLVSASSAADLRSLSKKILMRDEIDGAKEELLTGEGSFLEVSEARTMAWGDLAKIIDVSTPTIAGQSAIEDMHNLGDKRLYFVPCPLCGKFQVMKWPGFKGDTEGGKLKKVWYECEFCREAIFESHKLKFLPAGRWEPTKIENVEPFTRSYQLASWYAPLGFSPWLKIYQKYLKAQGNADKLKTFTNLQMGLPFLEKGSRPSKEKILALQGNYRAKTVPYGVLFLTMAVDVQRGSATDKNNPPRLEFEVCGHGAGYRTWSIDYVRIEGEVGDPYAGAWEDLYKYYLDDKGEPVFYYKRDDGHIFPFELIFIDSTDGLMSDRVYAFCSRWVNTYPIIGSGELKKRKGEAFDQTTASDIKRWREIRNKSEQLVYVINTRWYKREFYSNVNNVARQDSEPQRPGFCDFPIDYNSRYFEMLIAEDQRRDGTFYAAGRRNEALDCRVYNLCAGSVYLNRLVDRLRETYKSQYRPEELKAVINHYFALEYLSKRAGVKYERPQHAKSIRKPA
jgi:phage terminase large subunit GpA-like protein